MSPHHIISAILATALWGLNCVLSKIGMQDFPPLFYASLRFMMVVPALFFVRRPNVSWIYILALALFWGVIQFSCLNFAISAGLSVSLCTLLFQSSAFFAMFFSCLLLKEKPTIFQVLGVSLGLIGIAIIGWDADKSATLIGFILALTAAASWGLGNVLIKKTQSTQSFELLVWTSALPAFPLLIISLVTEGHTLEHLFSQALPLKGIACVLYSGFIAVLIGGALWMRLFYHYGVNQITSFGLLVPFFAILFSKPLLEENLTFHNLVAGGFIITGLLISQLTNKALPATRLSLLANRTRELKIHQVVKQI